jgi:hypothetical protein
MYVPKKNTEPAWYVHTDIFGNKRRRFVSHSWGMGHVRKDTMKKLIVEARHIQRLPTTAFSSV